MNAEFQAPICRPFWTWVMIALLAFGALVGVWVAIKIISYRIKLAAALKAEAARMEIADETTMQAYTWDGDKAYQTDEHGEDIRRRIKQVLVERKNQGRPPAVV